MAARRTLFDTPADEPRPRIAALKVQIVGGWVGFVLSGARRPTTSDMWSQSVPYGLRNLLLHGKEVFRQALAGFTAALSRYCSCTSSR